MSTLYNRAMTVASSTHHTMNLSADEERCNKSVISSLLNVGDMIAFEGYEDFTHDDHEIMNHIEFALDGEGFDFDDWVKIAKKINAHLLRDGSWDEEIAI